MKLLAGRPVADEFAAWRQSRMAFREALVMPDGRLFGQAMAAFQRRDFEAMDADPARHIYIERPRGASKTMDIAAEAVCEMFLGPPGGRLYAAAVDRDQAGLLHEAAVGWIRRTPLLAHAVRVERWRMIVPATGTVQTVLAADAPSSWGLAPTWLGIDEVGELPEAAEDLWTSLWSSVGKRQARAITITTPGWDKTSLCWRIREAALRSPSWYVGILTEPAPWTSRAFLLEQARTLPQHTFERLHLGRWTDAGGAFLSAAEVDGIFTSDLPAASGGPVAIGLDLGVSHDASVVAAVRRDHATGFCVVEHLETWRPTSGRAVDLREVEDSVAALARRLGAPVVLDPWQAVLLGQRVAARGLEVVEFAFTGDGRRRLFSVLLDLVRTGRLRSRPHEDLRRELLALEVSETAGGWRVDHRPGRFDDHAVAVGLAAQQVAAVPASAIIADIGLKRRETSLASFSVGRPERAYWGPGWDTEVPL